MNKEDIDEELSYSYRIENVGKPYLPTTNAVLYQNVVNAEVLKIGISKS